MESRVQLVSEISDIELVAVGRSIREIGRLQKMYGHGHWRKLKGRARVRLPDGSLCFAEVHWYEAHGLGRRDMKIKRLLSGWVAP